MPETSTVGLILQTKEQALKGRRKLRVPKPPRQRSLMPRERAFRTAILKELDRVQAQIQEQLIPRLPEIERAALLNRRDLRHDIDWDEILRAIFSNLSDILELPPGFFEELAGEHGREVARDNLQSVQRQLRSSLATDVFINFDVDQQAAVRSFASDSAQLIKTIRQQYLDEVQGIVLRNFRAGRRAESFAPQIAERFRVSQKRAFVIARDQVSKLNGDLTRMRQESVGVTHYIWRTVLDERTRSSHRRLNGKRFAWNDPPIVDGVPAHPGQPIQCRCTADPDFDALLEGDE